MSAAARVGSAALFSILLIVTPSAGQTVERLREQVEFLASDRLAGRLTGGVGERRAAKYLVRQLEAMGAVPLPGASGYIHPFEYATGARDAGSSLRIDPLRGEGSRIWQGTGHVRALSFSEPGTVTGSPVFAGYGLVVPDSERLGYDSYAGIDVKDRIVVVLHGVPTNVDDALHEELELYAGLRDKARLARERGAQGLLVVTGANSPDAGRTVASGSDAAFAKRGILAAGIGAEVAAELFRSVEGGLARAQSALEGGSPRVAGFEIPDVTLTLVVKVERERRTGRNVVGMLAADAAEGEEDRTGSWIVLGAHFDHLGRGRQGHSRAGQDGAGRIHPGADDNASGVAAVLGAAARIAAGERRAPVVLGFWSGAEQGRVGAREFLATTRAAAADIAAYLDFDCVGRLGDGGLRLQAVGSSSAWLRLIEQTNVVVGIDVRIQESPYVPSDAAVFYREGIPSVGFFGGPQADHRGPADRADRLNYAGLDRVTRFASIFAQKIDRLAEPPDYVEVERRRSTVEDRKSRLVYTGTVPDYAADVEGMRLSDVTEGGPAHRAGLRKGDVIIEFAGVEIANVHDYSRALGSARIGRPIKVICLREGRRMELTVTPTARP